MIEKDTRALKKMQGKRSCTAWSVYTARKRNNLLGWASFIAFPLDFINVMGKKKTWGFWSQAIFNFSHKCKQYCTGIAACKLQNPLACYKRRPCHLASLINWSNFISKLIKTGFSIWARFPTKLSWPPAWEWFVYNQRRDSTDQVCVHTANQIDALGGLLGKDRLLAKAKMWLRC